MRRQLIVTTLLLLFGCETTKTVIVDANSITQHPPMPKAIYCPQLEVDSIISDGVNPSVTSDAVFIMAACNEEIVRYLKDVNVTLCYYRENLNEPRCELYRNAIKALHSPKGE